MVLQLPPTPLVCHAPLPGPAPDLAPPGKEQLLEVEVNTSFSEDLAGPYLLVWDLSSSRMGAVELRFTEVITLEVNLAKTLL